MASSHRGQPKVQLRIESLEARRLLAVDLLANLDIESNAPFIPRAITAYNGNIIVRGNDGRVGAEAWITTGSPESTRLLKDIHVGIRGSGAGGFIEYQGQLFFSANNGFNGYELWVTTGSRASTQRISDIWPGAESGAPSDIVTFNDLMYFFANDGESGRELYRSDGTAAGTERVADSIEGRGGAAGERLTVVGDKMIWVSDSGVVGQSGLWVSDGTEEGTEALAIPGIEEGDIDLFTVVGDRLVFTSGGSLWVTDGTAASSSKIDPVGEPLGVDFTGIATSRGKLYVTDELGLHVIAPDFSTVSSIAPVADGVTASNDKVYFWSSAGFSVLSDSDTPVQLIGFIPFFLTKMGTTHNVPGGMLFNINKTLDRYEIWATDGTAEGTKLVETVTDGSVEPLAGFQQIGDSIYFSATNGNFRESLWKVPAPIIEIVDPGIEGDVNGDQVVDVQDVDAVFAAAAMASNDLTFDLDGDNQVSASDGDYLVEEILKTRPGDVDLNGKVEFADFLTLSEHFGDKDASWGEGDVNGDGEVSFADFLLLSENFGFVPAASGNSSDE